LPARPAAIRRQFSPLQRSRTRVSIRPIRLQARSAGQARTSARCIDRQIGSARERRRQHGELPQLLPHPDRDAGVIRGATSSNGGVDCPADRWRQGGRGSPGPARPLCRTDRRPSGRELDIGSSSCLGLRAFGAGRARFDRPGYPPNTEECMSWYLACCLLPNEKPRLSGAFVIARAGFEPATFG
jgi:hypothetical protein